MTLIYDSEVGEGNGGYQCDGCGAMTRESVSTSPHGAHAPAEPWIHRWHWRHHFCSPECVTDFHERNAERERERHNARRREQRARARAAREPIECARCGEPFTPKRSTARYCSTRCRVAAHRATAPDRAGQIC